MSIKSMLVLVMWMLSICFLSVNAKAQTPQKTTVNPVVMKQLDGPPTVLVRNGKPMATIVIPNTDLPTRRDGKLYALAAKELAHYVKLATGAQLPIVTVDQAPASGTLVLIGDSRLTRKANINADDLPLEGFRVSTFDRGIAIVGAIPKADQSWAFDTDAQMGTLYGVYDVLERFLGIRWYYPGEDGQVVPPRTDVTIPACTYHDAPVRLKRSFYTYRVKGMPSGTKFRAFARQMRDSCSTPVTTGCHTPSNFKIHFETDPECFQLKADGTRDPDYPCYGNPKTTALMISDLENYYNKGDKRPWTRSDGVLWTPPTKWTIHISPPDAGVDCHCDYCTPLFDADARQIGRASRIMVQFVDRMAKEVAVRWPEKTVFYLPYHNYTLPPAGATLPKNVVTGICLMRGAGNAKEPAIAADHDAMIAGWHKVTGNPVHLWEYLCWPADNTALPFQYPHVLQDFARRHHEGVEGSFINGGAGPRHLPGHTWAYQHWTIYCWMRLLWDPDFDVDAAHQEYLTLMYGPARKPMAKIFKLLIDRWEQTRWKTLPRVHDVSPAQVHEQTMPRAQTKQLKNWLAQARAAAGENNVYRRRVEFTGRALDLFFEESDRFHNNTGLPELTVLKVGGTPLIDGKLDEPCWKDAPKQRLQKAFENQADPVPGRTCSDVQAVWTPHGVTFGFTFEEPHPDKLVAEATVRNQANIWWEDCAELFLDVQAQRSSYLHIIANSLGTLWDGKPHIEGLTVGVDKGEDRWTVELHIPTDELSHVPGLVKPAVGAIWYGNFIRNRPQNDEPVYQRWNTLGNKRHADFSAFGRLRFVE